jgi:hypothetical protein
MAVTYPRDASYQTGAAATREARLSVKQISWGAIFAGAVVAIVLQVALGLLGTGVGFAVAEPGEALAIGAGIWWLVSGLLALFVGGFVAGHLAGVARNADGFIHGAVMWAVATLFSLWMLTTAVGAVAGGAAGILGQGAAAAAPAAVTGQVDPGMQQQAQQMAPQAQQAVEQARQMAPEAARAMAHIAIWAFVIMVAGALAAGFGGTLASPDKPTVEPPTHGEVQEP